MSAAGPRPEWQVKAEALREAAKDLSWLGAQGNTVEPNTAWAGVCASMDALRRSADFIEKENVK